jgi:hypothetical protein
VFSQIAGCFARVPFKARLHTYMLLHFRSLPALASLASLLPWKPFAMTSSGVCSATILRMKAGALKRD